MAINACAKSDERLQAFGTSDVRGTMQLRGGHCRGQFLPSALAGRAASGCTPWEIEPHGTVQRPDGLHHCQVPSALRRAGRSPRLEAWSRIASFGLSCCRPPTFVCRAASVQARGGRRHRARSSIQATLHRPHGFITSSSAIDAPVAHCGFGWKPSFAVPAISAEKKADS